MKLLRAVAALLASVSIFTTAPALAQGAASAAAPAAAGAVTEEAVDIPYGLPILERGVATAGLQVPGQARLWLIHLDRPARP